MKQRFEQMVECTGCNPNLLGLVLKTTSKENALRLLAKAIDMFAYTQQLGGVTRGFILAVGRHGSFSNFNLQDENFEYVKIEYNPEEVIS